MIVGRRMTRDPKTVAPEDSLTHAADIFRDHGFNHLPVVEGGRLVGIVSDTDLRNAMLASGGGGADRCVRDVMRPHVWSLSPEDSTDDALLVILRKRFGALPVLSGDTLVGIITKIDLLKGFADVLNIEEACYCVDVALPRSLAGIETLYAAIGELGVEARSLVVAPLPMERDKVVAHLRLSTIDGPAVRRALRAKGFVLV